MNTAFQQLALILSSGPGKPLAELRPDLRADGADALGVHAEVAAPDPRHGADVDARAAVLGDHAEHHVVLEAEQHRRRHGLDAALYRSLEPRVWQNIDAHTGQICWHFYDPDTGKTSQLNSEAELRLWLQWLFEQSP